MLSAPLTGVYSMKSRFVALIKSLETFFFLLRTRLISVSLVQQ